MATKFVFNPFTGSFDIINIPDTVCPIVDDWPVYADDNGALRVVPMLRSITGECVLSETGDYIYAHDPYIVP